MPGRTTRARSGRVARTRRERPALSPGTILSQDARELDLRYLLGHASPDMVRRYTSTYNAEQAARRHAAFSPAERLADVLSTARNP
jgi:hypothetical protein